MPIPINPYPVPGPGQPITTPDYTGAYTGLGLSGLAQGFTHGLELGHEWGQKGDEMAAHLEQMKNESDYRNAMLASRAPLIQSEVNKNNATTENIPKLLAERVQAEKDRDANAKAAIDARQAAADKKGGTKQDEALNSATAAYMAMDEARNIGKEFMPESSGLGAAMLSPFQKVRQMGQQTSPENNLADKSGEAATLFATAVNKAGGGRMTEAEVENMKKAMGGNGVGDTLSNIDTKHEAIKNELAAKMGLSRKQIEDAVAARRGATGGNEGGGQMFRIKASDGTMHDVPNLDAARKIDPNLTVVNQ